MRPATAKNSTSRALARAEGDGEGANTVRQRMRALMAGLWPRENPPERRKNERCVYPYLVRLVPVDESTHEPVGDSVVVVGKNLSEEGFDFYHNQSLPYRWMVATLEQPRGNEVSLLLELTWCRFNRQGWYDSGGRFRKMVDTPPEDLPKSKDSPAA